MGKMTETETSKSNTHPETIWNAKFISIFAANACIYISIRMALLIQTLEKVKGSYKK
jgi:hypothetical protein